MKAIIDKIEHLLCVASDAGKAEAGGDTATAERLDMELKRGVEVIEQALGPAETTSEICDRMWWPAIGGEHGRFRTFKENPADKHSPWHLVMPGGDSVPLNHCADDAVDEARCRWMVDALNRALGVTVTSEIERLRDEQAALVMPQIGPLLDAWDGMANDTKAVLREEAPDLAKALVAISRAMDGTAGVPAAEPLSDDAIMEIAHRTATRYTHRSDPNESSYGFMRHTLLDFARKVLAAAHGVEASDAGTNGDHPPMPSTEKDS